MCAIVFNDVSPFIITLFSSIITLPVPCDDGGYNGPPVALDIKAGVYSLGGYSAGTYGLPF